jgi:hypothetical protein
VLNVGDFEGKLSESVWRIYKRLSEGGALLPPAIGFIFDKEGRTETEQQDLNRESAGKVHFLPRRMYENYLINAKAIADLISRLRDFSEKPIESKEIIDWIDANRRNPAYFDDIKSLPPQDEAAWLLHVHGGKFLNDLFSSLSQGRYNYEADKVHYGIDLTSWLVKNSPESLDDVSKLLGEVLPT